MESLVRADPLGNLDTRSSAHNGSTNSTDATGTTVDADAIREEEEEEEDDDDDEKEDDAREEFDINAKLGSSLTSMDWLPRVSTGSGENQNGKPTHSYAMLITRAINSATGSPKKMTLAQIYSWIIEKYPYYKNAGNGWKNSIRHNLSLNRTFMKVARPKEDPGKGSYWMVDETVSADDGCVRTRRKKRRSTSASAHSPYNDLTSPHRSQSVESQGGGNAMETSGGLVQLAKESASRGPTFNDLNSSFQDLYRSVVDATIMPAQAAPGDSGMHNLQHVSGGSEAGISSSLPMSAISMLPHDLRALQTTAQGRQPPQPRLAAQHTLQQQQPRPPMHSGVLAMPPHLQGAAQNIHSMAHAHAQQQQQHRQQQQQRQQAHAMQMQQPLAPHSLPMTSIPQHLIGETPTLSLDAMDQLIRHVNANASLRNSINDEQFRATQTLLEECRAEVGSSTDYMEAAKFPNLAQSFSSMFAQLGGQTSTSANALHKVATTMQEVDDEEEEFDWDSIM